jgi:hypothetical protein
MKHVKSVLCILFLISLLSTQGCISMGKSYFHVTEDGRAISGIDNMELSFIGPSTSAASMAQAYVIAKQAGGPPSQITERKNEYVFLPLVNEKKEYRYEILEGPGAGMTLEPESKTDPIKFKVGEVVEFKVRATYKKTGKTETFISSQRIFSRQTAVKPYLPS